MSEGAAMTEMRGLTFHQPWAELVAIGAKPIETRSTGTSYRGPLLIHAAARPPSPGPIGDYLVRGFGRTGWALEGPGLPEFRSTPRLEGHLIRKGSVVAVAELVDVVPMVEGNTDDYGMDGVHRLEIWEPGFTGGSPDSPDLWLVEEGTDRYAEGSDDFSRCIEDQGPYGEFAPGRHAWLLEDIRPLPNPIKWRGNQARPWRAPAELVEQVEAQL